MVLDILPQGNTYREVASPSLTANSHNMVIVGTRQKAFAARFALP